MDNPLVRSLSEAFFQTLSSDQRVRKNAEDNIRAASGQPGFALSVLQVVALDAPIEIRQAAAVNFKNHVKFNWVPGNDDRQPIPDSEKEQIKSLLTGLMLSTPPLARAQLSEALSVVSSHDFPRRWATLLPELTERLKSGDAGTVHGVLETANSIFKRFRNAFMSQSVNEDLKHSQQFVEPLLTSLQGLTNGIREASDPATLKQLLSSTRLVLRIFFSMNNPGLTEEFEAVLDKWMAEFHDLLTYSNAALVESDPEQESVVDAVKAAVCENLYLFIQINEDEFEKYLKTFAQDVWTELTKVSLNPGQDNLAMSAIRFLTALAKSVHSKLFSDDSTLKQVCEHIVIPNIRLRDDMEEMFEMNWVEYVRRDTEGSDNDTRRRAATDLVKALTARFEAQVTSLFSGYVAALLAEHASNPAQNWKAKDCALYLVVALAVRGRTAAAGVTSTNQLVNIQDFFNQQVLPELTSPAVDELPILKADALKFLTLMRGQLSTQAVMATFGNLAALLRADSNVVHSYAALAIERLLASRENGRPRFTPGDLSAHLSPLFENLFLAFQKPESAENEYLMKCVMRVITFVGTDIAGVATMCLQRLAAMLLQVCQNPTQPGFNHYLFESVAALIKYSAAADVSKVAELEEHLFPAFNIVLQQDVQEFHPYVFQIFAQLIELRPAPLPAVYMSIFKPLLAPLFWERPGNVPALTRLLQAFCSKAMAEIMQQGHLEAMLGIFQKLMASRTHDQDGFKILEALLNNSPPNTLQPYMAMVWTILFQRLQAAKTARFVRGFLVFLSHFVVKRGPAALQASTDTLQPGVFLMILQQVWMPSMGNVRGDSGEKLVAVASTKVLCELSGLQTARSADGALIWGQLLAATLKSLEQRGEQESTEEAQPEALEDLAEESQGYTAAFAQLHNAARADADAAPDVRDPRQNLAASLARLSQASPGQVSQLVQCSLTSDLQQKLQQYCQIAGVTVA